MVPALAWKCVDPCIRVLVVLCILVKVGVGIHRSFRGLNEDYKAERTVGKKDKRVVEQQLKHIASNAQHALLDHFRGKGVGVEQFGAHAHTMHTHAHAAHVHCACTSARTRTRAHLHARAHALSQRMTQGCQGQELATSGWLVLAQKT